MRLHAVHDECSKFFKFVRPFNHPWSSSVALLSSKIGFSATFCFTRYDFRAGFWGVMGHPCLGIIPV